MHPHFCLCHLQRWPTLPLSTSRRLCRKSYTSTAELTQELTLVTKIVHHLIRRDNALIVVDAPQRSEGEADQEYAKRQQRERVLAVNPNFAAE